MAPASDAETSGTIAELFDSRSDLQIRRLLGAENRRFRELFEDAPVFLALLSGPDFRFQYANKAYERLVGKRPIIGKTVAEALPEVVDQGFVDLLRRVYESGQPLTVRDRLVMLQPQSGGALESCYLDFIYQPILSGSKITGVLVAGSDVTDQHLSHERILALQDELHQASWLSAMGTMATTLAHELNQPLSAIGNYVEGGRKLLRHEGEHAEALNGALQAIAESADRAVEIIARLREMTERRMVRKEVFDLEEAVREAGALAAMGPCSGRTLAYATISGASASADRIQFEQVLLNLIRNACEASARPSEAEQPVVTISTLVRGGMLQIRVADSGKGIAPEFMPRLFEPFASTKPGGMGLGLSISRTIVESQGGRIWAEDNPGGGAILCFTVPKA